MSGPRNRKRSDRERERERAAGGGRAQWWPNSTPTFAAAPKRSRIPDAVFERACGVCGWLGRCREENGAQTVSHRKNHKKPFGDMRMTTNHARTLCPMDAIICAVCEGIHGVSIQRFGKLRRPARPISEEQSRGGEERSRQRSGIHAHLRPHAKLHWSTT